MVFRRKVYLHGRLINRVSCPHLRRENPKRGPFSFENCKTCRYSERIVENGVFCLWPQEVSV